MWLFSILQSHPYDFTLNNFPGLLRTLVLLEIKDTKLDLDVIHISP